MLSYSQVITKSYTLTPTNNLIILLDKVPAEIPSLTSHRLTRLLSTFIAAWFSLELLQSKKSEAYIDYVPEETPTGSALRPIRFAGRTMDLTLFAVTRAVDAIVGELWSQRQTKRKALGKWTKVHFLSVSTQSYHNEC